MRWCRPTSQITVYRNHCRYVDLILLFLCLFLQLICKPCHVSFMSDGRKEKGKVLLQEDRIYQKKKKSNDDAAFKDMFCWCWRNKYHYLTPAVVNISLRAYRKFSYLCTSANQCWDADHHRCSSCQALICIHCRGGRKRSSAGGVWWQIWDTTTTTTNEEKSSPRANYFIFTTSFPLNSHQSEV